MSNNITIKESLEKQQRYIQNALKEYIEWQSCCVQTTVEKAVEELTEYATSLQGALNEEDFIEFFDKELFKIQIEVCSYIHEDKDYTNGLFCKFRDLIRDYVKEKLEVEDE